MAIKNIEYTDRTHEYLQECLDMALTILELRDWSVKLYSGEVPPKELREGINDAGIVKYDRHRLCASIFINIPICKEEDEDPAWNLFHEVCHIWFNTRDENEELQCNVLALLLMLLLGEKK